MSDQAGWECEECRRNGLEESRGCAWIQQGDAGRLVWARHGVASRRCPRSVIRGDSVALVEAYWAWKTLGGARFEQMEARQVHAFLILEREVARLRDES